MVEALFMIRRRVGQRPRVGRERQGVAGGGVPVPGPDDVAGAVVAVGDEGAVGVGHGPEPAVGHGLSGQVGAAAGDVLVDGRAGLDAGRDGGAGGAVGEPSVGLGGSHRGALAELVERVGGGEPLGTVLGAHQAGVAGTAAASQGAGANR